MSGVLMSPPGDSEPSQTENQRCRALILSCSVHTDHLEALLKCLRCVGGRGEKILFLKEVPGDTNAADQTLSSATCSFWQKGLPPCRATSGQLLMRLQRDFSSCTHPTTGWWVGSVCRGVPFKLPKGHCGQWRMRR